MSNDNLQAEVEALRAEVAELRALIHELKASAPAKPAPAAAKPAEIPEEHLSVIAAVVAAVLGKRATIRLVRPIHQVIDGWRLQGRANIQGSHRTR